MTVAAATPRLQYTGNGSTTEFAFTWPIYAKTDLVVYVGTTLKTVDTDYTVTFTAGDSGGGTIDFTTAPASSTTVTIRRVSPHARTADFATSGALSIASLNTQLDKLQIQVQDIRERLNRTVGRIETSTSSTPITISGDQTAGEYAKWDSDGNLTNGSLASSALDGVTTTDLASTATGKGASLVGIEDSGGLLAASNVEAALAEVAGEVDANTQNISDISDGTDALAAPQITSFENSTHTHKADSSGGVIVPRLYSIDTTDYSTSSLTTATLNTITITGGDMAATNGILEVDFYLYFDSRISTTDGGFIYITLNSTTRLAISFDGANQIASTDYYIKVRLTIINLTASTQFVTTESYLGRYNATTTPIEDSIHLVTAYHYAETIDTTNDFDIVIAGKVDNASDTLTLKTHVAKLVN